MGAMVFFLYSKLENLVLRANVRVKWLCRYCKSWGVGVMEYWKTGFGGIRSI
jgi:hypothetical protein